MVKEGRFGAYVTDGESNATLRKADSVESVTIERAAELLAEKRAKGPAPKKRAAKKTAAKKTRQEDGARRPPPRRPSAPRQDPLDADRDALCPGVISVRTRRSRGMSGGWIPWAA